MKRTYIHLLTLILLFGIFSGLTGTVYAAEFTDSGSIGQPYREAVKEMTARGVLAGFPDGAFHPDETLTREQGAKIVTYMVLGDRVNALTYEKASFDDVAANRWSAPCIAWCVQREILLGYGDGRYGPNDTLVGDQFAKMLLCAMSLARDGNYVGLGTVWYSAVREDARSVKLYDGDAGMATDRPITRQQAALLAWNAVRAAERAAASTPVTPPQPGGNNSDKDVETPEINIDPVPDAPSPALPDTPQPPVDERPANDDDSGDILLPEVP